ncbi:MAG TPA: SUF system NifU family Fe-S cluster assembly protein [Candidatus Nanoarchaeia archaeon]|nr:SUF system NifU family Fe-S cluster assembly protein [Candidatus Nanoarchaeia archaeon]
MMTVKTDFPILKNGLIYLDNSSTSQKPAKVIETVKEYYEQDNANVHRGIYRLAQKATLQYEKAHEVVAKFIGAEFEEVIFTKGTTEGLNLLAYSLGKDLQAGDEIVLSEMEHHSNIVPWQQIATEKGAVLKFIPITKDYRLDMHKAKGLISNKTKIVSVVHMSNVLGTINPVQEIAELAHKARAVMIVDAAQSVPHMKVNVKELNCDFLVFSGHKMCAPTGIGVLYGRKELLETMQPFLYGGDMIREVSFTQASWNDLPWKFEAGTPNMAGAAGLMTAVEYLEQIGMEKIAAHGKELTTYALEKLSTIPGLTIIGPTTIENRGPVISFNIDGIHPHDLSEMLDKENIAVRGGFHCAMPLFSKLRIEGSVRASFYIYNSKEDVDRLVEAVKNIVGKEVENIVIDRNEIASGDLSEEQEIYKENVIDHYRFPRNKKEMIDFTVTHRDVNPLCGDNITIYAKVKGKEIEDISFTGNGCAISQASASLLTEKIKGKSVEEIKNINQEEVFNLLGIPISHIRRKCALLCLKTIHHAVEEM